MPSETGASAALATRLKPAPGGNLNHNVFAQFATSLRRPEFWAYSSWLDIVTRYRRTRMGLFWLLAPVMLFTFITGPFYAKVMHRDLNTYMVHLGMGYAIWRRPTKYQAAVAIDEKLSLQEKFSTALYIRPSSDPFAAAAVQDAEQTAELERWARDPHRTDLPELPGAMLGQLDIVVTDDVGTRYEPRSSSAGGNGTEWRALWKFEPGVPATARRLAVAIGGDSLELAL